MYLWFYFLTENYAVFILHSQDKFLRTTYIQLASWATHPVRCWVSLCPLLFVSSLKWRFFSLLPHHNILHRIITVHCFSWTLLIQRLFLIKCGVFVQKNYKILETEKYKHSLIPSRKSSNLCLNIMSDRELATYQSHSIPYQDLH